MSGSIKLSKEERQEMIQDAKNVKRGKAFNFARVLSQKRNLDDYIDFLSVNMDSIPFIPSVRKTENFKL